MSNIERNNKHEKMGKGDPKLCVDCDHFYWDRKYGDYACDASHNDMVDRFRHAEDCEDFKEQ